MVKVLKSIGGYKFSKPSLLEEALTHPSLGRRQNYQRLEFLGDRVLGLVTAEALLQRFPEEAEGKLNNRFVSLVRKETLAEIAQQADFVQAIRMTSGAESERTREKITVQADVCEAIIGAVYLDAGMETAKDFVMTLLGSRFENQMAAQKDFKTLLQEWTQAKLLSLPIYSEVGRFGPDHNPTFTIRVEVETGDNALAEASSKRDAQQMAAKILYTRLNQKK